MAIKKIAVVLVTLALTAAGSTAEERIAQVPDGEFDRLHSMIKPQPGESPWREIEWLTNITEARRRAVAEDKPIAVLTAADGSPICRI